MEKKLLIVVGLMITLNIFWGFLVSIQLPFFPIEVRNLSVCHIMIKISMTIFPAIGQEERSHTQ